MVNTVEQDIPFLKDLVCYELTGGKYAVGLCPGCGYGIIANAVNRVLLKRGDVLKYPIITGVGCNTGIPTRMVGQHMHCLHGRIFAFATGLKLARPELKQIVISGDGDCLAIGLNHFLQAARRNVDMLVILLNNETYGSTGGQHAPTTGLGMRSVTAPYGVQERSFDAVELAVTAGATFVARWGIDKPYKLMESIEKALDHKGFSLIEALSICPTHRGRPNGLESPVEMLRWLKSNTIPLHEAKEMDQGELQGKYVVGEFLERNDVPELSETLWGIVGKVKKGD
ncbi:thiamine pyrophosphate-dependent enzyme [Chloroflexota bacterium]